MLLKKRLCDIPNKELYRDLEIKLFEPFYFDLSMVHHNRDFALFLGLFFEYFINICQAVTKRVSCPSYWWGNIIHFSCNGI